MISIILQTAARALHPVLLMFSLFLLMRGHNEPGGGFSGGLVAATAFVLQAMAIGVRKSRRSLRIDPRALIGVGLLIALIAGSMPLVWNQPFLTGLWLDIPNTETWDIGSPLLFDVGVYLVVVGMTLLIVWSLEEETEDTLDEEPVRERR